MRRDLVFYGCGLLGLTWILALWAPRSSISRQAQIKPPMPLARGLLSPPLPSSGICTQWDFKHIEGQKLSPRLEEMSGLVWSRHWSDTLYHITDSGNDPELLISNASGELEGKVRFAERSSDVEAISTGPCPWSGSCIFVADTGDNLRLRTAHQIHIIEEASLFSASPRRETIHFRYQGRERFDVEALAVHPSSGSIHLFTKEAGTSQVLELKGPFGAGTHTALPIARLPYTKIAGADYHPSGDRLILINWKGAFELSLKSEEGFQMESRSWYPYQRSIKIFSLGQQEAIAYAADGLSFIYSGERRRWSKQLWGLVEARCVKETSAALKN